MTGALVAGVCVCILGARQYWADTTRRLGELEAELQRCRADIAQREAKIAAQREDIEIMFRNFLPEMLADPPSSGIP